MNDCMPESEMEIQKAAQDLDMITSSLNCGVQVMVNNPSGHNSTQFVNIRNLKQLKKLDAVKRKKKS